ncbi:flavin reductase family protein [Halpernia frigidisoli]|uniref:Ring-1,2-phenylacetyl-CoA epoxidase subunit PaaE n=1 Tax=Halpernia frigidisoli TaxID=1125876 RepID=A0A1I3DZT8_9FLAO|nr:iron-sulfur cluster-binding domain-containing protein [Halpernia frigidisoli]SFH92163.1 ring-1,2-phenylacetyl-CoA epoxidase subunit PaaE [Halpernia frigidisoli]
MNLNLTKAKKPVFHSLKITKKELLTKTIFTLEFEIPIELKENFAFESGQYLSLKGKNLDQEIIRDYSLTSAPFENKISLGIKLGDKDSFTTDLFEEYKVGDFLEISEPKGRFTLVSKPNEHRTILGFAAGIGITPILSHLKNILHEEPRTRFYLFFGNANSKKIPFKNELDDLLLLYKDRLEIFYFYSKETTDLLFQGHLNDKKLHLIINQILNLDDTDEESTIWDAVDEILICGTGEMIKSLANESFNRGIPKKNIHFELFDTFNEDIYPTEQEFPLIENIEVEFKVYGENFKTNLRNNKYKLLQQLLDQGFKVPYSCKSGICGICECTLQEGDVELLENEYLTEKEEKTGKILACQSIVLSKKIKVNFDSV